MSEREFASWWGSVTTPMGEGFWAAVRTALAGPPAPEAARFEDQPTRHLATACAALQKYAGAGVFFLSCRTAQQVCGYADHMTASRRLKRFVELGLLELVEKGNRRRASRYRWLGQAVGEHALPSAGLRQVTGRSPASVPAGPPDAVYGSWAYTGDVPDLDEMFGPDPLPSWLRDGPARVTPPTAPAGLSPAVGFLHAGGR